MDNEGAGMKIVWITVLAAVLLLQGCGFHLRGTLEGSADMPLTYVQGSAAPGGIRTALSRADKITGNIDQAEAVLNVVSEKFDRRVLSVDSNGRVSEYEIFYAVDFTVQDKTGKQLIGALEKQGWYVKRIRGSHHILRDTRALPKPLQQPHPPVILGGTAKPRSAALAARFATEYNTPFATVERCRERRAALDLACHEVGRDPATLVFSLMTGCIVGEDRGEVLERVGRVLDRMGDRADPAQAIEERRDVWLVGTVEEVAERIEVLRTAGIERVFLQHLDHTDAEMIELIGRRLLPAVG